MWGLALGIAFAILVLAFLAIWFVARPRSHRWGTTPNEVTRSLLGDELVPSPRRGYTQAITINAPPENVWPWLVQMGYKRAGWYTYDWFYRLIQSDEFVDGHSSNRIVPELQNLKVGDHIAIFAQGPFAVVSLELDHALVMLARVDFGKNAYFELTDPLPANYLNNSWVFFLERTEEGHTRLITRNRTDYSPGFFNALAFGLALEGGSLIFQPKMLRGIKQRAEARADLA